MKCQIHKIDYSYTCPVCDEESGMFNGENIPFRAGFNGEKDRFYSLMDRAYYEKGKEWRKIFGLEKSK